MPVDTVFVRFTKSYQGYSAGERTSWTPEMAKKLVAGGVAKFEVKPKAPNEPPVDKMVKQGPKQKAHADDHDTGDGDSVSHANPDEDRARSGEPELGR